MHFNLPQSDRYKILNMFTNVRPIATYTSYSILLRFVRVAQSTKYGIRARETIPFDVWWKRARITHDILSHTSRIIFFYQESSKGMLISCHHKLMLDDKRFYTDQRLQHGQFEMRVREKRRRWWKDGLEKAMTLPWLVFIRLSAPHILSQCDDCISFFRRSSVPSVYGFVSTFGSLSLFLLFLSFRIIRFLVWFSIQVVNAMAINTSIDCMWLLLRSFYVLTVCWNGSMCVYASVGEREREKVKKTTFHRRNYCAQGEQKHQKRLQNVERQRLYVSLHARRALLCDTERNHW